jgi:Uma2 family endonuclease
MATVTKIGPAEHGRPMSLEEFLAGDYEEGYRYELIDGRLYVSPQANLPEDWVSEWLHFLLKSYAVAHQRVLRYVTRGARVFVPGRRNITTPEPDVAAYRRFPLHRPVREFRWQTVSPLVVAEVLPADDPDKDLIRNVALYAAVPSIKEYCVLDAREDGDRPRMTVYWRRRGKAWRILQVGPGERYTTPLLPDFELILDTRS